MATENEVFHFWWLPLSPHQRHGYCPLCDDDAGAHNHCSWCGLTFDSQELLVNHFTESDCSELIASAIDTFFGPQH